MCCSSDHRSPLYPCYNIPQRRQPAPPARLSCSSQRRTPTLQSIQSSSLSFWHSGNSSIGLLTVSGWRHVLHLPPLALPEDEGLLVHEPCWTQSSSEEEIPTVSPALKRDEAVCIEAQRKCGEWLECPAISGALSAWCGRIISTCDDPPMVWVGGGFALISFFTQPVRRRW